MKKVYEIHQLLTLPFIFSFLFLTQSYGQEKMISAQHNFTTFQEIKYADKAELQKFSTAQNHSEYGILPYNAPCEDCVELIEERTQYTRKFIRTGTNGREFLIQKGYSPLHYKNEKGEWETYNPKLKRDDAYNFSSDNQFYEIKINTQDGFIYFENSNQNFRPLVFHQNLVLEKIGINDKVTGSISANWNDFTAGEEGIRVRNIFPNVDLDILVYRDQIKTNFTVKQDIGSFRIKEKMNADFKSLMNMDKDLMESLDFYENGSLAYQIGHIKIFGNSTKRKPLEGHYSIDGDFLVYNWNAKDFAELNYPVIIDPTVSSTGTLPQASIIGAGDWSNNGSFTNGCLYNLSVPTPANCQITDIQWSFTYSAQNGGVLADGACKFYYGACVSPSTAGFFWFCNDPFAGGTCTGSNISIFSDFQSCIPAPQCLPYNMNFTMEFFDAYGAFNTFNCDPTFISAASDWTMTIIGETVSEPNPPTSSAGNTICEGSSTDLTASANYGVPPYTFSWDNGGGIGNPVTVSPSTTTTYTCTITDACGQTASNNITITVNPAPDAGTNGTVSLCTTDPITSLFAELGGTPDAGGSWTGPSALTGGSAGNFNPATMNAGVYTYTVTGTPPCSNASATVTVTLNPAPDAGTNGTATFCPSDPSADLFNSLGGSPDAGGTWSPAMASGTGVFDPSVDPSGTYTYTVTTSCGTVSADVTVTVNPDPDAGTNGSITLCDSDPSTDLFNQLGGSPDAGGSWSPAMTSGTGVFDPAVDPAGTYTYSVTNSCGTVSADIVVTVNPSPDAGTNGTATFCPSDPTTDLFNLLGGSPDGGGSWSPAMTSGTGVFDPSVDPAGTYTYTVTTSCGTASADVVVTINPDPDAGSNGSITLCPTDPSTDLFNELGGTPDAGGTWSPAMTSGTGVFDPSVDPAGTYTYAVTNSCGSVSADVVVTVNATPDAGTNGTATFCPSDPTADLFNSLGGSPDAGGTWSPAMTSGTGVFDPSVDPAGTYTYTVSTSCGSASADVVVTVNPDPDAGTNGSVSFCPTDPSSDLFNELGGSPDGGGTWSPAMASGTGVFDPVVDAAGTYTYSVTNSCGTVTADVVVSVTASPNAGTNGTATFCPSDPTADLFNSLGGTPDAGGSWSPALTSGTGVFDPAVDPAGTYTYTITTSCGSASTDVVVTINPAPDAGTNGAITLCATDPATDLFNELGGSPDVSGSWSPAMASGTGVFDPSIDPAGTYTYSVTNSCGTVTADVVVTITANPDPGTNGTATFCSSDAPADIFNSLGGTPDAGGTWSPALASGTGVFDPATDAAGTYTYTLLDCGGSPLTADVIVTVNPSPDAGSNGSITLCETDPSTDLFNQLGGTPDASGSWSPALTSGTGVFDPSVDAGGTYTYTVTNSCGSVSADVVVSVNSVPTANVTPAGPYLTTDGVQTMAGSPAGGTWSADCGACINSATGQFDPAVAGPGTWNICYTVGTAPCDDQACISVEVTSNCAMTGTINSNDPSCYEFTDGSVTINVSGQTGALAFTITDTMGTQVNTGNSNTANNLGEGWYYFHVIDDAACELIDSVYIQDPGPLMIDLEVNNPACWGQSTGLAYVDSVYNFSGSYNQISFFWTPNPSGTNGIGEDSLENITQGAYNLQINDQNGCSESWDFYIDYPDSLYFEEIGYEPAYCRLYHYQSGNGVVYASAGGGTGDYDYQWINLSDSTTSPNTTWGGLNPADYEMTVTDDNGCTLVQVVTVDSLNPIADFDLTSAEFTTDYEGTAPVEVHFVNQSQNFANPNNPNADTTFFWNFNTPEPPTSGWIITHDYYEEFDTTYEEGGTYNVCLVAINKNGCTDTSCVEILIHDPLLFVPVNVFTPNGDGVNDVFTFNNKSQSVAEFECLIVNRWGNKIFEMTSITDIWDGTDPDGNPCSEGVYFYTYNGVSTNGTPFKGQGTIQLVGGE